MSISSEQRSAGPFLGNGIVSTFPFAFKVFTDSDIAVTAVVTASTISVLTLDSDYTVTLNSDQNSNPGGNVVLSVPLAIGSTLIIDSAVPAIQPVDLQNQGGFYPSVINQALDRLTILIQQLNQQSGSLFAGPLLATADPAVFTITNSGTAIGKLPRQATVWRNFPLVSGVGYVLGPLAGQATFTPAPETDDVLFAQGVM